MNRSNKLFVAAVLLLAGYVLASLLGAPSAVSSARETQLQTNHRATITARSAAGGNQQPSTIPNAVGSVRLLPDLSHNGGRDEVATNSNATFGQPQTIANSLAPLAPPTLAPTQSSSTPVADRVASPAANALPTLPPSATTTPVVAATNPNFAKLDNSTPRPLWDGGHPDSRSSQPVFGSLATPAEVANFAPPLRNAAESGRIIQQQSAVTKLPPIATRPAPSADAQQALFQAVSAPPLARSEPPLRTHIIADGDTLAKLAKRYLNDPARSEEIFAANRELLTSPDLLPIGVELRIPTVRASVRGG